MSEAALTAAGRRTREGVAWRRRSRRVQGLRRLLPALVVLIFLVLAGYLVRALFAAPRARPVEAGASIQLVNPRFVGQDRKGRAGIAPGLAALREDLAQLPRLDRLR